MFGIRVHRVVGDSMSPTLADGDYLVSRKPKNKIYQPKDVVLAQHPKFGVIVKRVAEVDWLRARILLCGDNPASVQQQEIGWLPLASVKGKMAWHIPSNRSRRLVTG